MRFGLLGTGPWASNAHAPALAAHPEADLVGVWGRDPAKADILAARFDARGYADLDELLADVDAVAIALPPPVQADLAERAARAGRHLLLDKPLALTVAAADRVVAAADAAGVASVVFFTRRFVPGVAAFVAETAAGHWTGARCTHLSSIITPGNPYRDSAWRHEFGGLWDVGPHALSLLLPVLGPVDSVRAMAGPDQTSHLLLHHTGGAVSTLALTVHAPQAARLVEMLFYGPDGFARVPADDSTKVEACGQAITELIAAARSAQPDHPCGVRFGREVVAVLAEAGALLETAGRAAP
jgi:predicted dehydrogenase